VSKIGEGVADLMETFYSERGDEVAGLEVGEGCAAVWRRGEDGRVGGEETGEEVDLRKRESNSWRV